MTEPTLLEHTLVLLICAYMTYGVLRGQPKAKAIEYTTATRLSVYWTNGSMLWVGAAAAGGVWMLADRPLSELGLTLKHASPGIGAALAAAFVAWYAFETWRDIGTPDRRAALRRRWQRDCPFLPETRRELRHFSFLAITAGVTEEIIARGFLISYVGWFTGSSIAGLAAAAAIPAVAFAVAHRYQGWRLVVQIAILALFFGAMFVVTGSLLVPIILHALIDLGGGLISYRLARSSDPGEPTSATAAIA